MHFSDLHQVQSGRVALVQHLEGSASTVLCQDLIDYRCFKEIVKQWDEPGPKSLNIEVAACLADPSSLKCVVPASLCCLLDMSAEESSVCLHVSGGWNLFSPSHKRCGRFGEGSAQVCLFSACSSDLLHEFSCLCV